VPAFDKVHKKRQQARDAVPLAQLLTTGAAASGSTPVLQLWQSCATKQTNVNKPHLLVEERRGGDSLSDAGGLGCWDSPESE
jgi:hypothetical protein